MVSTQTDGLITCGFCSDGKRYTPKGLEAHLTKIHHRRLCPVCGADLDSWPFREAHYCDPAWRNK